MPTSSHKGRSLVVALLASTAMTHPAHAVELSGDVVDMIPTAKVAGPEGTRVLTAPGSIYQGDVITTDAAGQAQIKLLDNTRLVVGPNSKITIDEFVFKPDKTAAAVSLSALRGAFRFIGGSSDAGAYSISTPTATLGIRGTAVDFAIGAHGETTVRWREGRGFACVAHPGAAHRRRDDCRFLVAGDLVVAPPGGGFAKVSAAQKAALIAAWPISTQAGLTPGFMIGPPPVPPPDRVSPSNSRTSPYP